MGITSWRTINIALLRYTQRQVSYNLPFRWQKKLMTCMSGSEWLHGCPGWKHSYGNCAGRMSMGKPDLKLVSSYRQSCCCQPRYLRDSASTYYTCFISHTPEDLAFAEKLHAD